MIIQESTEDLSQDLVNVSTPRNFEMQNYHLLKCLKKNQSYMELVD